MIKIYEANNNVYYWNGRGEVPGDVVNVVIEDGVTKISKDTLMLQDYMEEFAVDYSDEE